MNALDATGHLLVGARPRAMAALVRHFRDLDTAEDAFQEACLRAVRSWPATGTPRDVTAWLVMVGRNAAIDAVRRRRRLVDLPEDEGAISDLGDVETPLAEAIDAAHYRDDVLRLLFVCCHPELSVPHQIALALRIVSGLSVAQIARAFLVSEAAMEQRITRAKARIGKSDVPFEAPGPAEQGRRLAAVATMVYLVFNEGYTTAQDRAPLCVEGIRLGRLLVDLFPDEAEISGLLALMLIHDARARARFDAMGAVVRLEDQDRSLWDRGAIADGCALLEAAMRHGQPGPYQVQAAIAALHASAARFADTDWVGIEQLYQALERMQPSPVVTLNRAVAVFQARGPTEALALIEPLAAELAGYAYFHGARGAMLEALGRPAEARAALEQAVRLAPTAAEAAHLRSRMAKLRG